MTNALTDTKSDDKVDASLDAYLRAQNIIECINANLPDGVRQLPAIPADYVFKKRDRETVSVAIHSAFELIGGLPAFMQWGANNPDKFYALWSKLLPSETETPIGGNTFVFNTAIPSNPLDLTNVDATGRVFTLPSDDEVPE